MEHTLEIMIKEEPEQLSEDPTDSCTESLITDGQVQLYNLNEVRFLGNLYTEKMAKSKYFLNKEDPKINKITEAFENMLGTKLIINKESNLLILKPYFCYEILFQLKKISNVNIKIEIIEKLNWLINKIHTNAFIITNKSTLKELRTEKSVNFMNDLIDIFIENNRENIFSDKMLNFIEKIIFLSGLKIKYIKHILERLADLFDRDKYDGNKFLLILKLLNRMFNKTIHDGKKFPEKYFFFNNTNAELHVDTETLQYKSISIVKGYSIVMWLRCEAINVDPSNKRIIDSSLIYYIHTSKNNSFEVFLKNKSLYYKTTQEGNKDKDKENLHYLLDIEYNKWTFLVFSHKPSSFLQKSEFTVWMDSPDNFIVKSVEFPFVKNQKLMSIGFFKDFTGQVSNLFMMNESILYNSIIKDFSHYTFGFYNERNIRIFKDFIERNLNNHKSQSELKSAFESIIFIYSPCRVKNAYSTCICKDLLNNINAEVVTSIEGNILVGGVAYDNNYYNNVSFLGGVNVFLPLFEFFTSEHFNSSNVLEEALNLLITIIDRRENYPQNSKFFNYLGIFFENYNKSLFSKELINKFLILSELLTRSDNANTFISQEFFKFILFNPKVFTKFDIYLQIELWKNISELYLKRIPIMNSLFDAKDIFEMIIKVYDNDINVYCCEDHLKMLCEKPQSKLESNDSLSSPQVSIPALINKVSNLLLIIEGVFTTNKVLAVEQLKLIIPFLAYEISPCLQKSFLQIFQKIISPSLNINSVMQIHAITSNSSNNSSNSYYNSNSNDNNVISKSNRRNSYTYTYINNQNSYTHSYNPLQYLDEATRSKYISSFIIGKGLEHILFILSISTLDVRLEVIKIIDLFTRMPSIMPINIEDELMPFIVHSLFPLRTPLKKESSGSVISSEDSESSKFQILNDFFENRDAKVNRNNNCNDPLGLVSHSGNITNLINLANLDFIKKASETVDKSGILIDITNLNNQINNLNNLNNVNKEFDHDNKIRRSASNHTDSSFRSNSNNNLNRNSLFLIEDEYWKVLCSNKIIHNLNIPYIYIRDYSNSLNDSYLDALYDYLLKWLTDRYEKENRNNANANANTLNISSVNNFNNVYTYTLLNSAHGNKDFSYDNDSDEIEFNPALNLIMKVIMNANIINKQKCLVDLLMLTAYNKKNCLIMIKNKYFYQWLLDLIFPFQLLSLNSADNFSDNKQLALADTIIELGVKIHTNIIINSILYEMEEETRSDVGGAGLFNTGENRKNAKFDHNQVFQFLLTWFYKIRKIGSGSGNKNNNYINNNNNNNNNNLNNASASTSNESRAAGNMLRSLLQNLINSFESHLKLMSPDHKIPIWKNFLNLTLIVYEFVVFSGFDKKISEKRLNFDSLEKNEILVEIIQNLNYDYEGNNEVNNNNINSSSSNNNNITSQYNSDHNSNKGNSDPNQLSQFVPNSNSNSDKNKPVTPTKNNSNSAAVSLLDIWIDRELLTNLYNCFKNIWHENVFKLDKKSGSTLNDEFKFIESLFNKIIFDNKPNFFIEDLRLLLTSSSDLAFENTSSISKSNNIMRTILNIIIIIIRLSENKNEVFLWLKELERFTLFIISATENAKIDPSHNLNESTLLYAQESTANCLIIVFNFLIEELNSPRRREFADELIDVFKTTLRFLFIYFTCIVEKIFGIIEQKTKKNSSIFISALKNIRNAIFFNSSSSYGLFSPCWKVYTEYLLDKTKNKIFSEADIKEYKLNRFVDFPEMFHTEQWSYAFQENNLCYKIIKDEFNFVFYEKLLRNRILEADNIKFNNDICSKEKPFINKVHKLISNAIKDSLVNLEGKLKNEIYDYFINRKSNECEWKAIKKELFQWKGKWCNLDKFLQLNKEKKVKYKVANHLTPSISRPVLFTIFDVQDYLPRFSKFNYRKAKLFQDIDPNMNMNMNMNMNNVFKETAKEKEKEKELLTNDYDNENIGYKTNHLLELKVKQTSNKSILHYNNSEFSDFVDKYSDIEKLIKYFQLFFTADYNKIIINVSDLFISNLRLKHSNPDLILNACNVKPKGHKKGKIVICDKEIFFIKNIPTGISSEASEEKCLESIFLPHPIHIGEKLILNIKISNVKQIYKRRFFYKKTACEVFTFNNKSYFFNFTSQFDRDSFCKIVFDNSNYKENPYLFEYHADIKKNTTVVNRLIEEWVNWRISNFDLIMNFNNLAGRSYHDLTQYPVFPWIITYECKDVLNSQASQKSNITNLTNLTNIANIANTTHMSNIALLNKNLNSQFPQEVKDCNIRDLSKPIGMLGNPDRVEMFKTTYKESCSGANEGIVDEGKFFYNSHYSNPFYVTNFLARLFPFTACAIELQGECFDNPQRQFLSLEASFHNSMTQATDVRELLPEFFYLPEMFVNINKINFGKADKTQIEDVKVPYKDPYKFIITNRSYLESEQVSYKINEWIDLIFGYKQKGKDAEQSSNLFWKFTYEDEIDIEHFQKSNADEYHSFISKIYFGQTPSQVLLKPLIQRLNKENTKNSRMFLQNRKNLRIYNSISESKNQYKTSRKDIKNKMMIKIKSLDNDRIICVYNNGVIQLMKVDNTPYTLSKFIFIKEKEAYLNESAQNLTLNSANDDLARTISDEDDDVMKEINANQPIKILKNGRIIAKGGYYDGKFLLFDMETQECLYLPTDEESKVVFIESDEHEKMLLVGTTTGRIYVFDINDNLRTGSLTGSSHFSLIQYLNLRTVLIDHDGKVNFIFVCIRLNVIATVAQDKTCNLYTYPTLKLFRVIKQDEFSFDYVFLSANPLPSVVLYSQTFLSFYCYSINGQLMHTERDGVKFIFTPMVVTDIMQQDHLVYGTQYGHLLIRPLPLLNNSWKIELDKMTDKASVGLPIKCFDMSKDKRSIFFWQLEDFNISVIRDPKDSKKKKNSQRSQEDENVTKNPLTALLESSLFDSR